MTQIQTPVANQPTTSKLGDQRKNVAAMLDKMKPQIQNALPKFITVEKMIRVAITAMSRTPKLLECEITTLLGAIMTSSQLGLMPDGVLGEAYLIPFKNTKKKIMECQFMIGYRGYVALALRSGQVKSIQARCVRKGDEFKYEFGLEPKLTHVPKGVSSTTEENEITHFYAVIQLMTGGALFEVMNCVEVNFIRDKSKAYAYADNKKETIWHLHYEEMGKKTVIRRLIKMAPLSPEINRAIGLDDLADVGANQKTNVELLDIPALDIQEVVFEEIIAEDSETNPDESTTNKNLKTGNKAVQQTRDLLTQQD